MSRSNITKRFFFYFLVLSYIFSNAQFEPNPFVTKGSLGVSNINLDLDKKGFESLSPWVGLEGNFEGLTFNYSSGTYRKNGADSTVANIDGSIFRIGYRLGPDRWSLGSNSLVSASVKPFLQISGSYVKLPDRVLTNNDIASIGLVFSPGIQLRFSHVHFILSYDAGLFLNSTFTRANRGFNIGKGFIGGTNLTIAFENAFDLLAPSIFSLRGWDVAKNTYRKDNGVKYDSGRGGYYRETVTTTITNYTPAERSLALVKPFWGMGPTYSFNSGVNNQARTSMLGVNMGVRFWYLMLDGFYEQGEMGLKSKVSSEEILTAYPRLRNYDFSSTVGANQYGGRIGFNLSKLLALNTNFKRTEESKAQSEMRVPFIRLSAFYIMGVTEFLESPKYTYQGAGELLLDYQHKRGISPSRENNPDFLKGTSTTFSGFGGSLEIGAAFINATWFKYKNSSVADHMNFTLGTNVPLGRAIRSARVRFFI